MSKIRLGVVATSRKDNEQRLPLHPLHLDVIPAEVRSQVVLEQGYGERFGISDSQLASQVGGLMSREQIFADCDVVLLFKPVLQDFRDLAPGQTLWGCPHFVQDEEVTQAAIDGKLNVIAMESMYYQAPDGAFISIAPRMGEMAGFCSVQHALSCTGRTGMFGRRLRAAVIGFGATGRGAVAALHAQGLDTTVLTRRSPIVVPVPPGMTTQRQLVDDPHTGVLSVDAPDIRRTSLAEHLADYDIIVNCVRQDTNRPQTFLVEEDLSVLTPGALIIDVSCDINMGFSWARPTTFTEPLRSMTNGVHYYAVDHSPSYLWDASTWILSEAVLPHLGCIVEGEKAWLSDEVVSRALETHRGEVRNPDILTFQGRGANYPHPVATPQPEGTAGGSDA